MSRRCCANALRHCGASPRSRLQRFPREGPQSATPASFRLAQEGIDGVGGGADGAQHHLGVLHGVAGVQIRDDLVAHDLRALFAVVRNVVVVGNRLRTNKAAFEVRVNDAGGLRRRIALVNGPGAHFLGAGREVGLQAEKFVARADHAVEPRFVHAHVLEEHLLVFVVEVGDFGFGLGADGDDRRVFGRGVLLDGVEERIVFKAVFGDV